jgi:exopolysaccharide biosynthesis operon protein EpsL
MAVAFDSRIHIGVNGLINSGWLMPSRYNNRKVPLLTHKLLWCCCFFNFIPGPAMADEFDTFQLRAGVNKSFDSNVLRQSSNEVSDQITAETVGLKIDKSYSLQRVVFDVNYNDYSYQKSDFLDYHATNYSGTWLWALTPNLHGNLSTSRVESLISFRDLLTPTKNMRTTKTNTFSFEYSPHHVWSLIGGISEIDNSNSRQFTAQTGSSTTVYEYGVKYIFASGSNLSLIGRQKDGTFEGRELNPALKFDNGFKEKEYDLTFEKDVNGKSTINAKIGYLEREYDNFSERDYNAIVGNVDWLYVVSGKIKTDLNLSRGVNVFETANSTYTVTNAIRTGLFYDVTSKIQTGLNLRLSSRDFEGRGEFDTSGRLDKERSISAFATWNPLQNAAFTIRTTKSHRNSSIDRFDFDDVLTYVSVDLSI